MVGNILSAAIWLRSTTFVSLFEEIHLLIVLHYVFKMKEFLYAFETSRRAVRRQRPIEHVRNPSISSSNS